ncbi:hypothetical protein XENTR_v10013865 [Xenopus tropicalis]|nr:hypothetical protein XENTR_v10013865 [Xenopus tropicalis]
MGDSDTQSVFLIAARISHLNACMSPIIISCFTISAFKLVSSHSVMPGSSETHRIPFVLCTVGRNLQKLCFSMEMSRICAVGI